MAEGEFLFPKTAFSKVIWGNGVDVTGVKCVKTISGGGTFRLDVGASATVDGTFTFTDDVPTDGTEKTLDTAGNFIKWRAVGAGVNFSRYRPLTTLEPTLQLIISQPYCL